MGDSAEFCGRSESDTLGIWVNGPICDADSCDRSDDGCQSLKLLLQTVEIKSLVNTTGRTKGGPIRVRGIGQVIAESGLQDG